MDELRKISQEGMKRALEKAERYRLLNEPRLAESICLDILAIDENHQQALIVLLLAVTDQFRQEGYSVGNSRPEDLLERIQGDYERTYYSGLVLERKAEASVHKKIPGFVAYEWFREAMGFYERAQSLSPEGNDDALLRWNTVARILARNSSLEPRPEENLNLSLE